MGRYDVLGVNAGLLWKDELRSSVWPFGAHDHLAPRLQSLCPDCKHMVLDVLDPMFKSGVADLMTLKYGCDCLWKHYGMIILTRGSSAP